MAKDAVFAAGLGILAAVLYLSMLSGSFAAVLLFNLAQLPLFIAGLWLGPKAVAIAGLAGSLATLVGGGMRMGIFFACVFAVPVGFLVFQALRWRTDATGQAWWYPPGRLAMWLVAVGIAGILLSALSLAGEPGGLEGAVRRATEETFRVFFGPAEISPAQRGGVEAFVAVLPGMAALGWLFLLFVNGATAQMIVARLKKNFRPSPSIAEIELPGWAPIAFAALLALAFVAPGWVGYVALNALLVSFAAFLLAGLAVLHVWARRFSAPGAVLGAVYSVMLFFGWPVVAVIALGFLEQWVGLRRRLAAPGRGE